MTDKMDLSLDEIITTGKGKTRQRGGGVVGGRVQKKKGARGAAAPYQKPPPRSRIDGKWTHDMFPAKNGAKTRTDLRKQLTRNATPTRLVQPTSGGSMMIDRLGPPAQTSGVPIRISKGKLGGGSITIKGAANTSSAILMKNLDPRVTPADVQTILSAYGNIMECKLEYNASGQPTGTCRVVFERSDAAPLAVAKLNGVHADGRILKVTEVGLSIAGAAANRSQGHPAASVGGTLYSDRLGPAPNGRLFATQTAAAVSGTRSIFTRVGAKPKAGRGATTFSVTV
ncbi:hypothetical protein DFJ77DRAFT_506565 [Powellomyces hirtus]|nr:hypothetical protein DFJ77DRAFT_506565 [Powellomyces hirtus]